MTVFRDAVRPKLHGMGETLTLHLRDELGGATRAKTIGFRSAGAEEIAGLARDAVAKVFPPRGAVDAETVAAPYVEFSTADLPWRYAPPGPWPWLVLAVIAPGSLSRTASGTHATLDEGARRVGKETLPVDLLEDAALLAHVVHDDGTGTDLSGGRARLICPRELAAGTEYVATVCVHPGNTAVESLRVLHHWQFRTLPEVGDARILARALRVIDVLDDARVAAARIDYPADPPVELRMSGVLTPAERDADPALPVAVAQDVAARRAPPDPASGEPVLGLPGYGARYAPDGAAWFDALNADPRLRAAASLGVEAARTLQDEVMTAARDQLGGLLARQRHVHTAQFGAEVEGRWRSLRFALAGEEADLLGVAGAFAPHVRATPGGASVAATLEATTLPPEMLLPAAEMGLAGQGLSATAARRALAAGRATPENAKAPRQGAALRALSEAIAAALDAVVRLSGPLPVSDPSGNPRETRDFAELLRRAETGEPTSPVLHRGVLLAWFQALEPRLRGPLAMLAAGELAALWGDDRGLATAWATLLMGFVDRAGIPRLLDDPPNAVTALTAGGPFEPGLTRAAGAGDWTDVLDGLSQAGEEAKPVPEVQHAGGLIVRDLVAALPPRGDPSGAALLALLWAAVLREPADLTSGFADPLHGRTRRLSLDNPSPAPAFPPTTPEPPRRPTVDAEELGLALNDAPDGAGLRVAEERLGASIPEGPLRAPLGLDVPGWSYLRDHAREWLVPGRDLVPDHTVAVMKTNAAFIDAFMVGFNEGVISELVWRGVDVDRSSTPCRNFWDLETEAAWTPDIAPIGDWGDTPLGDPSHRRGRDPGEVLPTDYLVIFLKTPLLRRYPAMEFRIEIPDAGETVVHHPAIQGAIDADVHFVGFDLAATDAQRGRLILEQGRADGGYRAIAGEDPLNFPAPTHWTGAKMAAALWRLRLRIVIDLAPHLPPGSGDAP